MLEPVYPDFITISRGTDCELWKYLNNEYSQFSSFINQILDSPSYSGLINESNIYFIADGFQNSPVKELLLSRLEIFGAIKDGDDLIILRGIKYSISQLLLIFKSREFKICNSIETELDSLIKRERIIFHPILSHPKKSGQVLPRRLSSIELNNNICIKDDFGEPEYTFPDYVHLSNDAISEDLKINNLHIAGTYYYTTSKIEDGTLCVLVARKDNPYDDHAIQVLRWIPVKKQNYGDKYVHPLYKLGYIPRTENHDLSEAMIKSKNYILFALYQQQTLSIIGNLRDFEQEPYSDYLLPYSLFNLLMR